MIGYRIRRNAKFDNFQITISHFGDLTLINFCNKKGFKIMA